jgi:hypothetical protein
MKRLFFIFIFLVSELIVAQPDLMVDSIVVKTSNDTVYVLDYNAWEQCAFQLDYTVDIIDSIITITQIDTAQDMTTCYGYHNFVTPVVGLTEGNYRIDIFRDCLYQDTRLIKSFWFEYIINGIDILEKHTKQFMLHNAYPNPFNPETNISYTIPYAGFVSLKIYNLLGQEKANLVSTNQRQGTYNVVYDAKGLSSGVYYYRLQFENKVEIKKILLLR